jgi:hypothetical protein
MFYSADDIKAERRERKKLLRTADCVCVLISCGRYTHVAADRTRQLTHVRCQGLKFLKLFLGFSLAPINIYRCILPCARWLFLSSDYLNWAFFRLLRPIRYYGTLLCNWERSCLAGRKGSDFTQIISSLFPVRLLVLARK